MAKITETVTGVTVGDIATFQNVNGDIGDSGYSIATILALINSEGGSGTVTSVAIESANGLAGTVAHPTTAAQITLSTTVTGVLKGDGTAISEATAGTDYQAPITLTTTGTSGAATLSGNTLNIPEYSGGGSSGAVTLLQTQTASNSAGITFTAAAITGAFDVLELVIAGIVPVNGSDTLAIQINGDSGEWYQYNTYGFQNAGAIGAFAGTQTSVAIMSGQDGSDSFSQGSAQVTITGANATAPLRKPILATAQYDNPAGIVSVTIGGEYYGPDLAPITSITVFYTGGNIASGKVSLYGISQ